MTTDELMTQLISNNADLTNIFISSIIDKGYDVNYILNQKSNHLIIGFIVEFVDTLPYGIHCSNYGYGVTLKPNNVIYDKFVTDNNSNLIVDIMNDIEDTVINNLLKGVIYVFKYIKYNEF